ncbi:MAG: DUF480 domain-containing protein [bacterium]|nr:DUF480 domain-containing protein [bacterium]
MKIIDDLNPNQIRVLGALLEKEQATPEYYPLTVNALIAACNQKSNRDPVMRLTETEVVEALDSLAKDTLVWRSEGARTERWRQSISRRLELDPEEKAVLTLLMLRGPQTVGELRSRSTRLHAFGSLRELEEGLRRLTNEGRELVVELSRRPGQKENRWAHLIAGAVSEAESVEAVSPATGVIAKGPSTSLADRVAALEAKVEELTAALERLEAGSEAD